MSTEHVMYDLGQYPGIFPTSKAADKVVGDVYKLKEPLEITLRLLDAYENVGVEEDNGGVEENEYVRREVTVYSAEEKQRGKKDDDREGVWRVWVYVYNWEWVKNEERLIGDGDFVKHVKRKLEQSQS